MTDNTNENRSQIQEKYSLCNQANLINVELNVKKKEEYLHTFI